MNELPRALTPWAEHLDLLPRELALAFGPLVTRVDALIGSLHRAPQFGTTEPDGFDGLARRGSYERLLLSEWLLADEAPDEFLRRAATGEHAFHRLAHRDPAAARLCVALFDAGPNQLGSPRLVHLAALLVLARRAGASGARFAWGVLQQPAHLHENVSPGTVRSWLRKRGVPEATGDHLALWQAALEERAEGESPRTEMELWLVGGHRVERLEALPASRLLVRDILEPGVRQVGAEVSEKNRPPREILLELPEEDACARLLRDPFAGAVAEVSRTRSGRAIGSNAVWSHNSNRLFARTADGTLTAFTIPVRPGDNVAKPKIYHPNGPGTIIGAGRVGKAVILAMLRDNETIGIEIHGKRGQKTLHLAEAEHKLYSPLELKEGGRLQPILAPPGPDGVVSLWLPLDDGRLVHIPGAKPEQQALPLDEVRHLGEVHNGALAATEQAEHLVYVPQTGDTAGLVVHPRASDDLKRPRFHPLPAPATAAFPGYAADGQKRVFGLWAVQLEDGRWHIAGHDYDRTLQAPPNARVVGVIHQPQNWSTPGLVLIEEDNRTLSLVGNNWSHRLPRASQPIVEATVSPVIPCVACTTRSGGLEVISILANAVVHNYDVAGPVPAGGEVAHP